MVQYFNAIGIFHPDDMSSIILTSFHRYLNNKKIDLEGQVQKHVQYWETVSEQEEKRNEEKKKEFEKYNIGDSVKMIFSIVVEDNKDRIYLLPKDVVFDENKHCIVKGIIRRKKTLKNEDYTVEIEATNICNRNEVKYGYAGKIILGETFDYSVRYFNIQKL